MRSRDVAIGAHLELFGISPDRPSPEGIAFMGRHGLPPKLRGGYYTPPVLAEWLCRALIRSPKLTVLEPGCGDGVFLEAAARQLIRMGADPTSLCDRLRGIEIDSGESHKAISRLSVEFGVDASSVVTNCDFFEWLESNAFPAFDCVLGNPPFIRFQNFPESSRSRAMKMLRGVGLVPNRLTNVWVPFVVGSAERLRAGGRLGLVLPAELLQVSYAKQLREYLVDNFRSINVICCNDLLFEKAQQEVVIVMATGKIRKGSKSHVCGIDLIETKDMVELITLNPRRTRLGREHKTVKHSTEKWLKYFLDSREIELMRSLRECSEVADFGELAEVDVGVVTGNNDFFVLAADSVEHFQLWGSVAKLIGRSAQLRGAILKRAELENLALVNERVFLFAVDPRANGMLPKAVRDYIELGRSGGIHKGYKCAVRKPWYSVPAPWSPDCFLFRQIHDFPRLVLNQTTATSTDTIHRVKAKADAVVLLENAYTFMTAASAEIEGRSYGGGVLELEPSEAERLLVPRKPQVALEATEIDRLVREGRLELALEWNSDVVLRRGLGLSKRDCASLMSIWLKMRRRRASRKRITRN